MPEEGLYKTLIVKDITDDVKGFRVISFEADPAIPYKAGQYMTFMRVIHGDEIRRSYSITSSPALNEPLSVGVKRIPNGLFSRYLTDKVVPGEKLITTGAGGLFILPDDVAACHHLFFLAAGSGITPVFSLIKTALALHPHLSITMVYSNTSPSKTIFFQQLRDLEARFEYRFRIEWLFSNAADLSRARLHSDLLILFLNPFLKNRLPGTLFYVCGPESYMRMCVYTMQQEGIPARQIRKENFVIHSSHVSKILPPDKATHYAFLKMRGNEYEIKVDYPDNILMAARKQGIALPYSCEVGRCGNCAARCISGKIWHAYNEVLTDNDLEKGLVLTCTGHPDGGDVVLQIT